MKASHLLFLLLGVITIQVVAVRQQQPRAIPIIGAGPLHMPSQEVNVPPRGEHLYDPLLGAEELREMAQRAHGFLFGDKDILKCFIFKEDCLEREREALTVIYDLLSSTPIAPLLATKKNMQQRITTAGEVLREYYEIPHQFASLSNTMQSLLLDGYRESNWMDRKLKQEVNQILGGYDTVIKNERLMKYLTHFYFGSSPTEERIETMRQILNPRIAPRKSGFQTAMASLWGAVTFLPSMTYTLLKQAYQWQRGRGESIEPEKEEEELEEGIYSD